MLDIKIEKTQNPQPKTKLFDFIFRLIFHKKITVGISPDSFILCIFSEFILVFISKNNQGTCSSLLSKNSVDRYAYDNLLRLDETLRLHSPFSHRYI